MKRLLFALFWLPLIAWAGVDGLWKDSSGEYWVVFREASGTTFAVQLSANLATSTLWAGSYSAGTLQLNSQYGVKANLAANSGSNSLAGTLGGRSFSATSLLPLFGSGNDGIYQAAGDRYLVYLTLSSTNAVLLVDLTLTNAGINHQLYWGSYAPGTRRYSGNSLTSSGALADLSFDDAGKLAGSLRGAAVTASPALYQTLPETDKDYLGYSTNSPGYALLAGKNVRVVNLPDEESFFAIYFPSVVQKNRIMLVVHGTDGTPYEEIKDELEYADQYGYIVIGIQWLNKTTGRYASGKSVYRLATKALDHLKRQYGNDLSRVAYVGFSRGGAISYETAWRDLLGRKFFDLTIAHSGGIPLTLNPNPTGDDPDVFFTGLSKGTLGAGAMAGSKFFFYCGQKDEQWGAEMCQQINNAKTLIEKNGGSVVRLIEDSNGKHAGYRTNPTYHTAGVMAFIDATP